MNASEQKGHLILTGAGGVVLLFLHVPLGSDSDCISDVAFVLMSRIDRSLFLKSSGVSALSVFLRFSDDAQGA